MHSFSYWVLLFMIYSCMGWICESIWCSVGARKLINRGFMTGPWCPIYGFGALLVLHFALPQQAHPFLVFLITLAATTSLEYFTGWLMESLFQIRWWDYSGRKFNLKGRVCLRNSLLFGVMGVVTVYLLQPLATGLLLHLSGTAQRLLASAVVAVFFFDLLRSFAAAAKLDEQFELLWQVLREMDRYQRQQHWFRRDDVRGSVDRLRALCLEEPDNETARRTLSLLDAGSRRHKENKRLLDAFPVLRHRGLSAELSVLRDEFEVVWEQYRTKLDITGSRLRERRQELRTTTRQAYRTVSPTNLAWVFLMASVLGFVVETLYCLVTTGGIESRQGMLYGPFSQIYGFGAVLMVLLLLPFAYRSDRWLFVGGAVVGGLFEAACSLLQEQLFGSVSWEYSQRAFSFFGGRTNLLYMFFWGILALIYLKHIYPHMTALIERIPPRAKHLLTWGMVVALSVNLLLSGAAVSRWSGRVSGLPAQNSLQGWLDRQYPDDLLQEIYPNLHFVTGQN